MPKPHLARTLSKLDEKDRRQIEKAEELLGAEPETLGFMKSLYWGRFREDLMFPYPEVSPDERERCDRLLEKLDEYLRNEHPSVEIDQTQEIPRWAIDRLFGLGVMGMIIPPEYGGGGFCITSYNRVLARIGESCGSTAVLVSAHQSIGCGALKLFGTEEQKQKYLPRMANDTLSAFCLSEPNVGCDAGGQETRCETSEDGEYYILNGEKKWATSGALSGLFTVMAKHKVKNPKTGAEEDRVTALICTPDMEGIDIFSRNRAKCGIRGTWQARIRFKDVKVPKERLLHREGRGLNVALTCLNYGRCTLSAGMVGAGRAAYEQGVKWAQYRYQFERPIADFELIQEKVARMSAYVYAMEAMLYWTTGVVDREDEDIMVETAVCKLFCSEMGFRTVDDALQIMGGEGYMTENTVERLWRDSRINIIVEGANEVMHGFIFGYGSKQLGEWMLGIYENPMSSPMAGMRIGAELYLGVKRERPSITKLHPRLAHLQERLERQVQELRYRVGQTFKEHEEKLITNQMIQRRISWASIWIHALACSISRADKSIREGGDEADLKDELTLLDHIADMAENEIDNAYRELHRNTDETMKAAAQAVLRASSKRPNSDYVLPERTPDLDARGTGLTPDQKHIAQFGSGTVVEDSEIPK